MSNDLRSAILNIINTSDLFSKVNSIETEQVIKYFKIEYFNEGDVVFTEGSFSKKIYFVSSGAFEIVSFDAKYHNSKQFRILKPGEHFSELSILTKSKHGASAFALESGALLSIESFDFFNLLKEVPQVTQNLIINLATLTQETIKNANYFKVLSDKTVTKFEQEMVDLLPLNEVLKYKAVPLRLDGMHLVVGMVNPLDVQFYSDFKVKNLNYEIRTVLINDEQFNSKLLELKKYYASKLNQSNNNVGKVNKVLTSDSLPFDSQKWLLLLKKNTLFSKINNEIILKCLPFFEFKKMEAHQDIFQSNINSDNVSILLSGAARLFKRNTITNSMVPLYKLDNKNVIFDVGIFTNEKLNLTARTLVDSELCIIPRNILNQLLKSSEFSISFAISLAETLWKINKFNDGISVLEPIEFDTLVKHGSILSKDESQRLKVIVIDQSKTELTVASPYPTNRSMLEYFANHMPRYLLRYKLISDETYTIYKNQLDSLPPNVTSKNSNTLKLSKTETSEYIYHLADFESVDIFKAILENAFSQQASDIHIESLEDCCLVRYRVDGVLMQYWESFPKELGTKIIQQFKSVSSLDITETHLPQDGHLSHTHTDIEYRMKVSVVPTRSGEKIVLRITNPAKTVVPLRHLSSEKNLITFLKNISKNKQGLFVVAGPAKSGKSATLYSILNEINNPKLNIVTIEDPIEVNISRVNQTEVQSSKGLTFELLFKNLLRQDPDVILINEIRDAVSMQLSLEAVMSGRLVLTSIHASNSVDVVLRLKELCGASTSKIANQLLGVISQRLVRKLCHFCKSPRQLNDLDRQKLNFLGPILNSISEVMESKGCEKCNHVGFSGQIPLFEYWNTNEDLKKLLLDDASNSEIVKNINESNFESFNEYGLRMVAFGLTTFQEVEEVLFGVNRSSKKTLHSEITQPVKKKAV